MTDTRTFLDLYADDIFHLPYLLVQETISQNDGGIADLFESDDRDHGSGFANAGGYYVVGTLLRHYPADEVADRIATIDKPDIRKRFVDADLLTKEAIPEIAHEVARLWHGAMQKVFPEIAHEIGDSSPSTVRALTAYLKLQHCYTTEYADNVSRARTI